MFPNLNRDLDRLGQEGRPPSWRRLLEAALFDNGFQAVVIYRLARWFRVKRVPLLPPLLARWGTFVTGAEISPGAEIGPGLKISHGVGLVVGGYAKVGQDALLLHGATIGSPSSSRVREMPVIGDRVFLGANAAVIGAVTLGDDVKVGANAVVTRDLPSGIRVRAAEAVLVEPGPPGATATV
ncbi:MAG TPA: DapH/DapD/GlmU-related protein [Thermoanaerobaculia bacterium]|nr:DapH/DapD/GlmU-related protein [Thermoanaerobaculia bacterium]